MNEHLMKRPEEILRKNDRMLEHRFFGNKLIVLFSWIQICQLKAIIPRISSLYTLILIPFKRIAEV
jgi:hypothetical protein